MVENNTMTLWEFSFGYDDGTIVPTTIIAEGITEVDAASSAQTLFADRADVIVSRPGRVVPPEVEKRWREVADGGCFPAVMSDAGRLALYARGIANPALRKPDTVDPSQVSRFLGIQVDVAILIFGLLMASSLVFWVKRAFF
jgi:hypothetical protein